MQALTSFGVCDTPEIFYSDVNNLLEGLGHNTSDGETTARRTCRRRDTALLPAYVAIACVDGAQAVLIEATSVWTQSGNDALAGAAASDMFTAHQAKGVGYAMSTEAELRFSVDVAQQTGACRLPFGLAPKLGHPRPAGLQCVSCPLPLSTKCC